MDRPTDAKRLKCCGLTKGYSELKHIQLNTIDILSFEKCINIETQKLRFATVILQYLPPLFF